MFKKPPHTDARLRADRTQAACLPLEALPVITIDCSPTPSTVHKAKPRAWAEGNPSSQACRTSPLACLARTIPDGEHSDDHNRPAFHHHEP